MLSSIAIKVNQATDIEEKWDADLDQMAVEIAQECAIVSMRNPDDKKYIYNAGHFDLKGLDKKVYYVCAFNRKDNSAELFFSHSDALFKKAYADYEKSDGKIDPSRGGGRAGGMVN